VARYIEDIVAAHQHASALRRAGKCIWPHKINLKVILDSAEGQESPAQIVEIAHRLAAEIRRLPQHFFEWGDSEFDPDFLGALKELEKMTVAGLTADMGRDSEDAPDVLDGWLEEIYTACDRNRIWTRG
jgi:hypothetical protein